MVARIKSEAKQAFGDRLSQFLEDRHKVAKRGRVMWLYERLKAHAGRRELVSYEAVRKWVAGKEIPDEANKAILCKAIEAKYTELFDHQELSAAPSIKLQSAIGGLSPDEEVLVIEYAKYLKNHRPKRA